MNKIKAVVFNLRNIVFEELTGGEHPARLDDDYVRRFGRLINFLRMRRIQPVLFANDSWEMSESKTPVEDKLRAAWGDFPAFFTSKRSDIPRKPAKEATAALLAKLGCSASEVLYIGNSEIDMRTAVNGGVLFLNGTWIKDAVDYGFKFQKVKDVARFIDVFCERSHDWHFKIEDGPLRFYALAPFSTQISEYESYSRSAVATAKDGIGNPEFWGRYVCATLLLTGLHQELNHIAPFPSHRAHTWKDPLRPVLDSFAKCFRKSYVPDLVVRHTDALKSQYNRDAMSHRSHLDTLHLHRTPLRSGGSSDKRYVHPPTGSGKTILLIDDFCTKGYSLEAARAYLERTGSKAIMMSWLKTINRPYVRLQARAKFDPYSPNDWKGVALGSQEYPYRMTISDDEASKELAQHLAAYNNWTWPAGC